MPCDNKLLTPENILQGEEEKNNEYIRGMNLIELKTNTMKIAYFSTVKKSCKDLSPDQADEVFSNNDNDELGNKRNYGIQSNV